LSLKTININCDKIKSSAFEWCIDLESVKIENIKYLEAFSFAHCLNLKNVNIKGNIKKIHKIFEDTPKLKNIEFISDSLDIAEIKKSLKDGISTDVKLSDELKETLKSIEDNKKILEKLDEKLDYSKYEQSSPKFLLSIQQKLINNKLKLIEKKNDEMKSLKEINKDNLNDVHDKILLIQEKLNDAIKEYENNKNKINELKEDVSENDEF